MTSSPPPDSPDQSAQLPAEPPIDRPRRSRGIPWHLAVGFLMGTADLVPGVSGGTVALAGGIYPRLIAAIHDATGVLSGLFSSKPSVAFQRFRKLDWALLVPLLAGILTAVALLASVVEHLLETSPVRIGGLFLGLVLGSVIIALGMLRRVGIPEILLMVAVAVLVFVILGLVPTARPAGATGDVALWAFGASGALAICAMILPGISGSFLLVSIGMYGNVLNAVNDRRLVPVLVFVAGCAAGLAAFSRLLSWLINNYHDRVLAAMIGLMLGSVRILWPWPGGPLTSELGAPAGDVAWTSALALLGFIAVVVIARISGLGEEDPAGESPPPVPSRRRRPAR